MDQNTEFNIIVKTPEKQVFFWDSYRHKDIMEELPFFQKNNYEVLGFVTDECARGFHACQRSALYDDMSGYVDVLQNEATDLRDDEEYIVCWYSVNGTDLNHNVDFGISKEAILDNVRSQKYIEGASYFPTDKLLSLEDIEIALGVKSLSLDEQIQSASSRKAECCTDAKAQFKGDVDHLSESR